MDPSKHPDRSRWQECPAETLAGLVHQQRRLSRRETLAALVSGGVTVAATVVCGIVVWRSTRPRWTNPPVGNANAVRLNCESVMNLYEGYQAGTVACCVRKKIDQHLLLCKDCASVFRTCSEQDSNGRRGI